MPGLERSAADCTVLRAALLEQAEAAGQHQEAGWNRHEGDEKAEVRGIEGRHHATSEPLWKRERLRHRPRELPSRAEGDDDLLVLAEQKRTRVALDELPVGEDP